MTEGNHLGDRKLYLGSSDAAAALGLNPWKSSYELFQSKQPGFEVVREDNPLFERGHKMEDVMAVMLEKYDRAVGFREREYAHRDHPWLKCHVDGIMPKWTSVKGSPDKGYKGAGLLEMKAPGSHRAQQFNSEGIAKDYIIQGQLNMYLSQCLWGSFVYLDYDAWDLKVYDQKLDVRLVEEDIIPSLVDWWEMCQGGEFLEFPDDPHLAIPDLCEDKLIINTDDAIDLGRRYADAKDLLAQVKTEKDMLEGQIKELVESYEKSQVGCIDISWKKGIRTSWKNKNLLALAEKEVENFDRNLYVTEKESRTFRATVRKED